MKLLMRFLLILFLLSTQNLAFAIVHKNSDNTLSSGIILKDMPQTETRKAQKPTIIQRYLSKIIAKKQERIYALQKKEEVSQGDKLAKIGLKSIIGGFSSIAIFVISAIISALTILFAILAYLGFIALLVGLVLCIIALTSKDITDKGKKNARTGLWLVGALFLLYIILIFRLGVY